jgi:hypothetical protein
VKAKRSRRPARDTRRAEDEVKYLEKRLREAEEKVRESETRLGRAEEIERIRQSVEEDLKRLVRYAKEGERLAGEALAVVAGTAVSELSDIARQQPKMFLRLSRKQFAWPGLVSSKRGITERNKELLKLLQVGKNGIYSNKKWQISAPSTRLGSSLSQ